MKKNSLTPKKQNQSAKLAPTRGPVQRDTKAVWPKSWIPNRDEGAQKTRGSRLGFAPTSTG